MNFVFLIIGELNELKKKQIHTESIINIKAVNKVICNKKTSKCPKRFTVFPEYNKLREMKTYLTMSNEKHGIKADSPSLNKYELLDNRIIVEKVMNEKIDIETNKAYAISIQSLINLFKV